MSSATENEKGLYGREWDHVHHGYFSDPTVAAPLLEVLIETIYDARPSVVADLGGGTGFIIDRLLEQKGMNGITFVNVDTSSDQLRQILDRRIKCVPYPIEKVTRADLLWGEEPLLLCMRSVLHYFGREGLEPMLGHLRAQMRSGEFLIHQTACFRDHRDQGILNLLYEGMGTGKWYPSVGELTQALEKEGWVVRGVNPAPSLVLPRDELMERYRVSEEKMADIAREIEHGLGHSPAVFPPRKRGSPPIFIITSSSARRCEGKPMRSKRH